MAMTPDQYHRLLKGLDGLLDVFSECEGKLTPEDIELKLQLTLMRAHALRAESGHPFPSMPPSRRPQSPMMDPELTIAPFRPHSAPPFPQKENPTP